MKKGHVSNSQNVKDSLHGNKRLRKIIINLRIKVEICISTHSNADIVCYRATELNERNSVRLIVDRTHTHTHLFNGPFSGTIRVSWYQKGKPNLDFTEARDSESQWHQLGHMQVCTSLQTDNHASTPPLRFLQAGCPSCHPTNSVKALKTQCKVKNLDTLP